MAGVPGSENPALPSRASFLPSALVLLLEEVYNLSLLEAGSLTGFFNPKQ